MVSVKPSGDDVYRNLSPLPLQIEGFRRQIQWAIDDGLPSVICDRDTHRDSMRICRERDEEKKKIARVKGAPKEGVEPKASRTALEFCRMGNSE